MLEAIVFDFDGVIVDSEPLHYQAFVMVGKGIGFEFSYEEYLATYIGFDDRDAFRVMLEASGEEVTAERVAELLVKGCNKSADHNEHNREQDVHRGTGRGDVGFAVAPAEA